MKDIEFDVSTREMTIVDGDLTYTEDSSMQHAGIILDSKSDFLDSPMLGIGFTSVVGDDMSNVNYELNRWKEQTKSDGAKIASFQLSINAGVLSTDLKVQY